MKRRERVMHLPNVLRWVVLTALAGVTAPSVRAKDADWDMQHLLGWRSTLWSLSPREFMQQAEAQGYRWRARDETAWTDQPWCFGDVQIRSSALEFRGQVPIRWVWTIHDRGLHGQMPKGWVEARFVQTTNAVQQWAASAPMVTTGEGGARALVWGRPPHIVTVESMERPDHAQAADPERLRVMLDHWPPRRQWEERVVRSEDGDCFLAGIPMVEQRVQGNCAPATVERVMRYFGIPLEMANMARLAESTLDAGTNVERMMTKIRGLRGMQCDVRVLLGFEVQRFERTIHEYNEAAVATHAPAIQWEAPVMDLARIYNAADATLLRQVAARQSGKRGFERDVQSTILAGLPLVWGVVLGVVPEKESPPGTKGGHLRLIVGYNAARHEILYSDPWGKGHEQKRMTCDDAWAMTISLHVIEPPQ